MNILKLIGGVLLTIGAIFSFIQGEKARMREREEGEFHTVSVRDYGVSIIFLIIAGFLFFSVIDP